MEKRRGNEGGGRVKGEDSRKHGKPQGFSLRYSNDSAQGASEFSSLFGAYRGKENGGRKGVNPAGNNQSIQDLPDKAPRRGYERTVNRIQQDCSNPNSTSKKDKKRIGTKKKRGKKKTQGFRVKNRKRRNTKGSIYSSGTLQEKPA